jgi:hypothetical protein
MERKHFESLGENFDRGVCRILWHDELLCFYYTISIKVKMLRSKGGSKKVSYLYKHQSKK